MNVADFKKSVVYQIYPKSFSDSNGDGWGDLKGVTSKLDYIKELGADYIWLTPFFVSPQNDNGYDVEDYYNIDPRYGTMEDFEELAAEAEKRGIRLMLDMVFNHTSSRHEWFQKALAGDEKYKNFYIFRKGKAPGVPPTNWESKFGGNVWEYVEQFDEYYLHLFDVSQPDLNWDNEEVRKEMQKIVRFWMEKGVKGFRFDVVNLISKSVFEDDYEGDGRRFYTDGPNIHKYLQELNAATFGTDAEIITVGEMSSTSMENCYQYAGGDGKELSMVFSFHHLKVDFMGNEKWVLVPADFQKLKDLLFGWQKGMQEHDAWNAVFWCNHDQPRVVSRFGSEGKYWKESAKMLATMIHLLRGTPYIYQGEELGMTNVRFDTIGQYEDIETLGAYKTCREILGMSEEETMAAIHARSRDNARTPMQWDDSANGGFTAGTPWFAVNPNYTQINAASQVGADGSVYEYYRELIRLRHTMDVIVYGRFDLLLPDSDEVFAYTRTLGEEKLLVLCNFTAADVKAELPEELKRAEKTYIIGNYGDRPADAGRLRPYEAVVYRTETE